jgi:hypothetical protein
MQRIDAGYLYELGDAVRGLRAFRYRDVPAFEIWQPLNTCQQMLPNFMSNSVFSGSLRGVVFAHAKTFEDAIDALIQRLLTEKPETVTVQDQALMQQSFERFEPVLQAELSNQVVYHVQPKGVYDVIALVEEGTKLFPPSIMLKAPEATNDTIQGAKALAFELWTAAAFHFHRANEAVLRRYYDLHVDKRPIPCTMGTMLRNMKQRQVGHVQVIAALDSLTAFHRNPNSHPGHFVDDSEQAFSLVAAIRAAMGYMLDELPMIPFDELMAVSEATAPPLIVAPLIDQVL